MENSAKSLENGQILVVRAETYNNKTNKSKITNTIISLGLIIAEMKESTYFEQITINDKFYQPMLDGNQIILWPKTQRAKTIFIKEFKFL